MMEKVEERVEGFVRRMLGKGWKKKLLFYSASGDEFIFEVTKEGEGEDEDVEFVDAVVDETGAVSVSLMREQWFRNSGYLFRALPKRRAYGRSFEDLVWRTYYGFTLIVFKKERSDGRVEAYLAAFLSGPGKIFYATKYAIMNYPPGFMRRVVASAGEDGLWRFEAYEEVSCDKIFY